MSARAQRLLIVVFTAGVMTNTGRTFAQSPAATLNFEVATLKVAPEGPNGVRGGCHGIDSLYTPRELATAPPLGRCVISDARLSHLIGRAWGVTMQNLQSGPDWIQRGALRFHVQAKAEDPTHTTEQQLLTMLQNLLVDRFKLKFHFQERQVDGFALSVAKGGPKLKASKSDDSTLSFTGPKGEVMGRPYPGLPAVMTARKYSVPMLMNIITLTDHGPGLDQTGLTGEYDFTLSWDDNAGPDISTALREQLGLRMVAAKVPVSVFVVDSAEKPSADQGN